MSTETSVIEVTISIAVSEDGAVTSCIKDDYRMDKRREYDNWLDGLRKDQRLWSVKTIKTNVFMPEQFEEV